jgi:hypothetical protein
MEKIAKEGKKYFSHSFTVPEETESKPPPQLAVLAIATAPPIHNIHLYSPLPEDEEWDRPPDGENVENGMRYLHNRPDKDLRTKNDHPLTAYIPP